MSRPKPQKKSSRSSHRNTLSLQKTEVLINVYDLLSPGHFSNILWTFGASLLHSGVVINGKEYAYGGHDRHGVTGVYWTKPRTVPPGGTFRCEILHGFAMATPAEIDSIVRSASAEFLGPSYNLLTKNCNHFTAHLCRKLTGRPGPSWLNRAASIGLALPCVVPREWIEPPEYDTADGELLLHDDNERRYRDSQGHDGPGAPDSSSGSSVRGSLDSGRVQGAARASYDGYNDGNDGNDGDDDNDTHDERASMLRRPTHRVHLVGMSDDSIASAASSASRASRAGSRRTSSDLLHSSRHPGQPSRASEDGSRRGGAGGDGDHDEAAPRASTSSRRSGKGKAKLGPMWDSAGHALPPSERVPT